MTRTHSKGRTPLEVPHEHSLTTRLWQYADRSGGQEALRYWADGAWQPLTWHELADRVRGVAAGLIAMGIESGDRVALMAPTSAEWTIADLAILAAGGVTVPVYETSATDQCAWILADSGAKIAICADADMAATLEDAGGQQGALSEVFVLAEAGLEEIARRGDGTAATVDERVAQTTCDAIASVIYTSGTTGRPKGCVLTHGNILITARQAQLGLANVLLADGASTLLFIPLAHIFARVIQFALLDAGTVLGYARSIQTLSEDLQTFEPTFLLAVPRIFEKVFNAAQAKAQGSRAKIFQAAVDTATEWSEAETPTLVTSLKRAVFDRLVYAKLRAALGGRVAHCISGGAPLAPHLAHFFRTVGVEILEGYGLTETTAASAVNPPEWNKIGTVGQPWPGTEFRVADDGELLIRGPGVFREYWQNPEATKEVLDDDGWFSTGDLGTIDDDGFIAITGRKKELIVTAGGKNVAPAELEERLKAHRLISQAMVVGDKRPFVGALITLDPDELTAFASEHGLGDVAQAARSERVRAEVDRAVAEANAAVSRAESIRRTAILERDFLIEEGELTPTLKVRRMVVADHFSGAIEDLYET